MFMQRFVDHLSFADMPQPVRGQVERRLAVGEGADHTGAAPNLAHDEVQRVVGSEHDPVLVGDGEEAEGL